ncbi:MAG: pyruvate:ferredoxin (flavodoxin) oxidoreductase [Spirochaetes bacterium]|nr:pyruvate:ferredoxin (flavodoxin) oxidoreductase [Spirochaetota bacterium]
MNNNKAMMASIDGNTAAAHAAYAFTEIAGIYPITPSSPMAELVDEWAAYGRKNIFGETVKVIEMQSEAGAAGVVHGALQCGALATTFTAAQGLLLMIPNMYKISGELLPGVFHVSARSLSTHALSIFGDHADVYAARQTGFAMIASGSVQEVMDLASISHLCAIEARIPFLQFFDGFRTSHEIQKIELIDYEVYKKLLNWKKLAEFRKNALGPDNPVTRGTAQNPDIYFQFREAQNIFYNAVPGIVQNYMQRLGEITGRKYSLFDYFGSPDAERVIVAMGSVVETARLAVEKLTKKGEKVGVVAVRLFRPFSSKALLAAIPTTVTRIAVLDRTKEPGSLAEPLCLDVRSAFYGSGRTPVIVGGRYGLSSKDTTAEQILAVFENLAAEKPKDGFTIGIIDDVTHTSLPTPKVSLESENVFEAKFFGIGADGTVGANKNSIKIIGDRTEKYVQAYFAYDSKKSGGVTVSHLRFADRPIRETYLVNNPDFVACHVPAYLEKYDVLKGLKPGGTFLLNSLWEGEELEKHLPARVKRYLAQNNIRFFIINATRISEELGMPGRTNTIMQAAFFKVSGVIPYEIAVEEMKDAIKKTYGKKGDDIVEQNYRAVDRGGEEVVEVKIPEHWKNAVDEKEKENPSLPEFVTKIMIPIMKLEGDNLPVSAFLDRLDGTFPQGTTAYEKRGVAINVPEWIPANCIQCNQCSYVCPHAAIRPFLLNAEEKAAAPKEIETLKAVGKGLEGLEFRIQVTVLDCMGCGNCAQVCPAKEKALVMKPLESQLSQQPLWDYLIKNVSYKDHLVNKYTVKGSQFAQPLFEFSGACAGCGETPYIKLITQLFGERMIIANATGCSSIYGGSAPSTPYCKNADGRGPAWASSLFEDNAEYGYGMQLASAQLRMRARRFFAALAQQPDVPDQIKGAIREIENAPEAIPYAAILQLKKSLESWHDPRADEALILVRYLDKRSIWIVGGDGWAYDIGFGGLDHVLASGDDVNLLVLDTEVYSNTGGQSSKSTPTAAIAKFAASGKKVSKKDLGLMAISYGYVYVAQIAMGANQAQTLRAIREAESYPGPSLIIAYSSCINHGIRAGMMVAQEEMRRAVECGYWHLYRYDPRLLKEGKNPFMLDSKEPDWSLFRNFLLSETRFSSLQHEFPDVAEELFKAAEENARRRYERYRQLAAGASVEEVKGGE